MKADKDAEIYDAEHVAAIAEFNEKAALARVAKLEAALPVIEQMLLEVEAAIHRGPSWYTHGKGGMADQVLLHVQKVRAVLKDAPR